MNTENPHAAVLIWLGTVDLEQQEYKLLPPYGTWTLDRCQVSLTIRKNKANSEAAAASVAIFKCSCKDAKNGN